MYEEYFRKLQTPMTQTFEEFEIQECNFEFNEDFSPSSIIVELPNHLRDKNERTFKIIKQNITNRMLVPQVMSLLSEHLDMNYYQNVIDEFKVQLMINVLNSFNEEDANGELIDYVRSIVRHMTFTFDMKELALDILREC